MGSGCEWQGSDEEEEGGESEAAGPHHTKSRSGSVESVEEGCTDVRKI